MIGLGQALVERFDGEVPRRLDDLVTLPGVGRKTANVVLGNAFGVPGITVDTHFGRLVRRFGWTAETDPVKVEAEVAALIPKKEWTTSHRVIWHGRRVCHAKKPACGACGLARWCPSYGIGPTDPEVGAEAGQDPRGLGHRVRRRASRRRSVRVLAARRLHAGRRWTDPAAAAPDDGRRATCSRAPSSPTQPAEGARCCPRWRSTAWAAGSLDLGRAPGVPDRRQPLGQLVRALPGGAAADAAVRRRRGGPRAGPRRDQQGRADRSPTRSPRTPASASPAPSTAGRADGRPRAQRAAVHLLPRRRRRAGLHAGRPGRPRWTSSARLVAEHLGVQL